MPSRPLKNDPEEVAEVDVSGIAGDFRCARGVDDALRFVYDVGEYSRSEYISSTEYSSANTRTETEADI